jgi:hypothetical protein
MLVFPTQMDKYQAAELYLAWKVMQLCNIEAVSSPDEAQLAIAWNATTQYVLDRAQLASLQKRMHVINARCTDIRKSLVDRIFGETFGYSLGVDPLTSRGTILRKSEKNGTHDAVLLEAPFSPEDGFVYQRLITPVAMKKGFPDFRTFIVGGEPVAVNRNFHPVDDRFHDLATYAEVVALEDTFTPAELARIRAFNERIGLEFGVLDVMRDRDDGRIYVMDCNNTPTGPARKMPLTHQLRLMKIVAEAFEKTYVRGLRARRSSIVGELPNRVEETLPRR